MPYEFELRSMRNDPISPEENNSLYREAWRAKSSRESTTTIQMPSPSEDQKPSAKGEIRELSSLREENSSQFKSYSPYATPAGRIYLMGGAMAAANYTTHLWDKAIVANPQVEGMARLWKPFSSVSELSPAVASFELAGVKQSMAENVVLQKQLALEKASPSMLAIQKSVAESLKKLPTSELLKSQNALFSEIQNLTPRNLAGAIGSAEEVGKGVKLFASDSVAGKAVLNYAEKSAAHAEAKAAACLANAELAVASTELNAIRASVSASLSRDGLCVAAHALGRGAMMAAAITSAGYMIDQIAGKKTQSLNWSSLLLDGFAVPSLLFAGGPLGYGGAAAVFLASRLYQIEASKQSRI